MPASKCPCALAISIYGSPDRAPLYTCISRFYTCAAGTSAPPQAPRPQAGRERVGKVLSSYGRSRRRWRNLLRRARCVHCYTPTPSNAPNRPQVTRQQRRGLSAMVAWGSGCIGGHPNPKQPKTPALTLYGPSATCHLDPSPSRLPLPQWTICSMPSSAAPPPMAIALQAAPSPVLASR